MEKMKEIVVVAPQELLSETAKNIVRQSWHNDVEIIDAFLERAENIAQRAEQNGAQVLLSLPFTAANIRKFVKIPVLDIEINPFNLLEALFQASKTSNKIAYLGFHSTEIQYDFKGFIEILGNEVDIVPLYYKNREGINEMAKKAVDAGFKAAVVTGKCVKQKVEELGLKGFMVEVSNNSVKDVIARAREIVAVQRYEKQKRKTLQTILDLTNDGIISIDKCNRINLMNKSSEKILNISPDDIIGSTIEELNNKELKGLLKDSFSKQEKIYEIQNKKLIVKKSELNVNSEVQGSIIAFQDVTEIQKLDHLIRKELSSKGLLAKYHFSDIIGESKAVKQTIKQAERIAKSNLDVLIIGETGSGKELFAHSIHNASSRKKGPFVAINCATLPEGLLESELFGYENGAFTGAKKGGKLGLFELAHGGTLFLDEMREFPLRLQARLLRVLQEKEVRRVGGERIVHVDVRVVAATNVNLIKLVNENKFRADLYYRLSTLKVNIPPLRQRKDDIEKIIKHLLKAKFPDKNIKFSKEIFKAFSDYDWPGNVRELENILVRLMLFSEDEINYELVRCLIFEDLYENDPAESSEGYTKTKGSSEQNNNFIVKTGKLEDIEESLINELINKDISKAEVANILGISRTTLWRKIKNKNINLARKSV